MNAVTTGKTRFDEATKLAAVEKYVEGFPISKVCAEFGVGQISLRAWVKLYRPDYNMLARRNYVNAHSPEYRARIVQRFVAGETAKALAEEAGVAEETIGVWVRKAGHSTTRWRRIRRDIRPLELEPAKQAHKLFYTNKLATSQIARNMHTSQTDVMAMIRLVDYLEAHHGLTLDY